MTEEVSVSPTIGLMCIIDNAITCKNWLLALHTCNTVIHEADPVKESCIMRRACRIFVEIMFALPKGHEMRQDANAVQMLVFSKVPPYAWNGTVGIAAEICNAKTSQIGNVVVGGDKKLPLLITADNWCAACHSERTSGKCKSCDLVHYCSELHQKSHWPIHKFECLQKKDDIAWNSCATYERNLDALQNALRTMLGKQ